jgi:hypothetical protein
LIQGRPIPFQFTGWGDLVPIYLSFKEEQKSWPKWGIAVDRSGISLCGFGPPSLLGIFLNCSNSSGKQLIIRISNISSADPSVIDRLL